MKRAALLVGVLCALSANLDAQKGIYKIKKAIENYDLAKAIKAIKLAGPLDLEEKNSLLELAAEKIEETEKITMNKWDILQIIGGSLFALMGLSPQRVEKSDESNIQATRDLFWLKALLGALGIGLMVNGFRASASRARHNAARKIEEALENAPQKSFHAVKKVENKA